MPRNPKTPARVAANLKAASKLGQATKEVEKTERVAARVERKRLQAESKQIDRAESVLSRALKKVSAADKLEWAKAILAAQDDAPSRVAALIAESDEVPDPEPPDLETVAAEAEPEQPPAPGYFDPRKMHQPPEEEPAGGYFIPEKQPDPAPEEQPNRVEVLRRRLQATLQPGVSAAPAWLDCGGVVRQHTYDAMLSRQPRRWYEGERLCRGLTPWWGPR